MNAGGFVLWVLPLAFFQLYLAAVGLLFFNGPWPWIIEHPFALSSYLVAANIAIALGYLLAWPLVKATPIIAAKERAARNLPWLKASVTISVALAIPTSMARTGSPLPDVISGFTDTGQVYISSLQRLAQGNLWVGFEYIRFLFSPLLVMLLPATVVYWGCAGATLRFFAVSAIVFYLSIYFARGQTKGIADVVGMMPFFLILADPSWLRNARPKACIVMAGSVILASLLALTFFERTQTQRGANSDPDRTYYFGQIALTPNSEYWLTKVLPERANDAFVSLARYLGQGYQAISLTLRTQHESTFGVGHSMFLSRNFDRLLDTNYFTTSSLPAILERETGWPMWGLWHSVYPWIASDVGYGGALVVVLGLAFVFGLSWGKSLRTADSLWLATCSLMLILFFYLPANNQIFQSGETTFAFILTLFMILTRSIGARIKMRNGRWSRSSKADTSAPHI